MKLDIIAQLVQILKDAPELGAIEVRRGLFGSWSVVRLTKAGHQTNAGGQHVVVTQAPGAETASASAAAQRAPAAPGGGAGGGGVSAPPSPLLEIKSPMVGTVYAAPEPGAWPYVKGGGRGAPGTAGGLIEAMKVLDQIRAGGRGAGAV